MCDRCNDLDLQIQKYRRFIAQPIDPLTTERLNAAVAELCIGSLLALLRRLPQADRYVRTGRWTAAGFPLATSLAGKHVGIAGMGRIGKEIARRLEMFGVALA